MSEKIEIKLDQDSQKGEFSLFVNDKPAGEMTFIYKEKNVIDVDHTGVNPELKGLGLGKHLMEELIKFAKENDLKVIPSCPYVKIMIERNIDYQQVLYSK
ncbi:MAG: N-acetyltransferase [Porphyromonadaceae bacterium]|nr:N-acetyltransferase [Porphyromonadaceae bacterium]